jgi:hypothetical protein
MMLKRRRERERKALTVMEIQTQKEAGISKFGQVHVRGQCSLVILCSGGSDHLSADQRSSGISKIAHYLFE